MVIDIIASTLIRLSRYLLGAEVRKPYSALFTLVHHASLCATVKDNNRAQLPGFFGDQVTIIDELPFNLSICSDSVTTMA